MKRSNVIKGLALLPVAGSVLCQVISIWVNIAQLNLLPNGILLNLHAKKF